MGRVNFFALWSVREAPRQFICKSNRLCYQVHMPLPLPKQLVVFGLGEWTFSREATISVEVTVSHSAKPQRIGTVSAQRRCLTWEGDWAPDLLSDAVEKARRGVQAKVLLSVGGEERASFVSSTPLVARKQTAAAQSSQLSGSSLTSAHDLTGRSQGSALEDSVSYAELMTSRGSSRGRPRNTSLPRVPGVWRTDKTPRRTVIGLPGRIWTSEGSGSLGEWSQAGGPRKRRLGVMSESPTEEECATKRKKSWRTERWSHTMCLSDPQTAVLIGGEAADQAHCPDSLWKLETESDFWFPMDSTTSGPLPLGLRGHTATFDPESKVVYVYGGLREGQRYSDIYVLDTTTWRWKVITAKGTVPALAYHSATIYQKELYVFGGAQPGQSGGGTVCSNSLYIFNPEFGLWYQPITEGQKPLARFGHSATLLSNKLLIFGGRKTAVYLNDLHILDLGFMEYSAMGCQSLPPLPRGFHAALPVSNRKLLVSGGCSTMGALRDIQLYDLETNSWCALACPALCTKPRAGHTLVGLGGITDTSKDQWDRGDRHSTWHSELTILVFGGSDCAGTFYNDTVKCTLMLPEEERKVEGEER